MKSYLTLLIALTLTLASLQASAQAINNYKINSTPVTSNASWLAFSYFQFNITINMSATNVTVIVNGSSTTLGGGINYTMVNTTSDNMTWGVNITQVAMSDTRSNTRLWENSNKMNVSVLINYGGGTVGNHINFTTVSGYEFYLGLTDPIVRNVSNNNLTNSTFGDAVYLNFSVEYNSTDYCQYDIYYKYSNNHSTSYFKSVNGSLVNTTNGNVSIQVGPKVNNLNCSLWLDGGNFTNDGYYIIQPRVRALSGRLGFGDVNVTLIINRLIANQWNAVGILYQDNSSWRGKDLRGWTFNHTLGGNISSASGMLGVYLSWFNSSSQSFVTYQRNTTTNANKSLPLGDGLFIYPTMTTVLMRINETEGSLVSSGYENYTLPNASNAGGVWGLVGVTMELAGYNTIDYFANITDNTSWATWINNSDGQYYTWARGFSSKNKVYVIKGSAIWLDTNMTAQIVGFNRRTRVGWYGLAG